MRVQAAVEPGLRIEEMGSVLIVVGLDTGFKQWTSQRVESARIELGASAASATFASSDMAGESGVESARGVSRSEERSSQAAGSASAVGSPAAWIQGRSATRP